MTRSKALEISVAGPKRVFALLAELHGDAKLLLTIVSAGTKMCVCAFVSVKPILWKYV